MTEAPETPGATRPPEPTFVVTGAAAVRHAAAPALEFTLGIGEPAGNEVYAMALVVQVQVEPARRRYDPETRTRLVDLFGAPERWAATTRAFPWARRDLLVGSFQGAATARLQVECSYDLELAAVKYFYSLSEGEVPLAFHFNGTVLYRGAGGRVQAVPVPWDRDARFALPIATWREMMDHYYPGGDWIRLGRETVGRLRRFQSRRGLPSLDACVDRLLAEAEAGDPAAGEGAAPAGREWVS